MQQGSIPSIVHSIVVNVNVIWNYGDSFQIEKTRKDRGFREAFKPGI